MFTHGRQKDDAAGEVPVAFVVRAADSDIAEDAIKEFVSKQVRHLGNVGRTLQVAGSDHVSAHACAGFQVVFYKRLHKVYFTQSIPKSASGKILRRELRAKLAAAATA